MARYALVFLLSLAIFGCAVIGPAVKFGTAGLSAGAAYWSYKALKTDPVNVTTLSKECTFIRYIRIPCDERKGLSAETKQAIALNNQLAVELCGIPKPEALVCQ